MTLKLKGLKITWIGFLLSLIGSVISGVGAPRSNGAVVATTSVGSVIGGIISIISVILIIVGLSMIKDVSDHYRKARNYEIVQIIIAIVFVALVMGLVVANLSSGGGLGAGAVVLCIIMVVILAIFSILFYRHLLKGCEATAVLAGDNTLAEKCCKLWKLYIISFVIVFAGVIIMFIGMGVALSNVTPESVLFIGTAIISAMAPGMIILTIGAILMLIFTILLLVRMAKICAFDGKMVESAGSEIKNNVEDL